MKKLDIYKYYKTLVVAEKFILTGSTVLHLQGLIKKEPGDLDIILVNPDQSSVDMLNRLQESSNKNHKHYNPNMIQIFHEGLKVDFFVVNQYNDPTFDLMDGTTVDSVGSIIKAKKGYNRDKDILDLMAIARGIPNEQDVLYHLNSSRGSSL